MLRPMSPCAGISLPRRLPSPTGQRQCSPPPETAEPTPPVRQRRLRAGLIETPLLLSTRMNGVFAAAADIDDADHQACKDLLEHRGHDRPGRLPPYCTPPARAWFSRNCRTRCPLPPEGWGKPTRQRSTSSCPGRRRLRSIAVHI